MKDRFGREIDYLRISITDRCNLRCRYCMPPEGVVSVGHENILRFDEILQLVKIFCAKGVKNVKITGGEPLVRRNAAELIGELKKCSGIEKVTVTTNGTLLCENIDALAAAGTDGINISLDSLDSDRYRRLTGGGELSAVLAGLDACANYPKIKLKLNCVLLADTSLRDIFEIAAFAERRNIDVRFIETMPIGLGRGFAGAKQDEIKAALENEYGAAEFCRERRGQGPAVYYSFPDFCGKIGFISPMSHMFCENCNRIRLTADGFLKSCLQYAKAVDLRTPLRAGISHDELERLIAAAIYEKPKSHCFAEERGIASSNSHEAADDGKKEDRLMSGIGG